MGEMLTDLVEWMTALPVGWAYVMLLLVAYGENVVPPIPGDMAVVFAGYLVGVGRLDFGIVVLLSTLGGAAGFMTMYALGYRVGMAILDPERLRWLPKERIGRVERWLRRYGYGVVLANRFLSGLRSVISLTVGIARMHPVRTSVFASLSALAWTLVLTYAGYALGDNWVLISGYLRQYGQAVAAMLVLGGAAQLARHLRKRPAR